MELISFLGKLFGYTPEIANVISGELRSVSEARRRPKIQQKIDEVKAACRNYYKKMKFMLLIAPKCHNRRNKYRGKLARSHLCTTGRPHRVFALPIPSSATLFCRYPRR